MRRTIRVVITSLWLSSYAWPTASEADQIVCNPTNISTPWLCDIQKEGPTVLDAFADSIHESPWVIDPNSICGGHYIEPQFPFPNNPPLSTSPIAISADESTLSAIDGKSYLSGQVLIAQGNRFLRADEAIMTRDMQTNEILTMTLAGRVKFIEPGLQFYCDHATTQFETGQTTLYNTRYYLPKRHVQGATGLITIDGNQSARFAKSSFSTCPQDHETWVIYADDITFDQKKGRGTASHARLYLKDIPVFYLPYIDFPIDNRRQTGFLYPSFGTTSQSGFEARIPYYWNIAPNYDLTLTPRLLTERGLQAQGRFRYLSPKQSGELRAAILPQDKRFNTFKNTKRFNHSQDGITADDPRVRALDTGDNRYAFAWEHRATLSPNWQATIDYHRVGDDNYFVDLGNNIHANGTERLKQEAALNYHTNSWSSDLRIEEYQTLHPYLGPTRSEVYRKQPQWFLSGNVSQLEHWADVGLIAEVTNFNHKPDPQTHQPYSIGYRLHAQPSISRTWARSWGYVRPQFQWALTTYDVNLSDPDKRLNKAANTTRNLPIAALDAGLFFEKHQPFGLNAYYQTLEPRLFYHWAPYKDQRRLLNFDSGVMAFSYDQMFRTNRFSGLDRIGDANQVTAAMTTRFIQTHAGLEKLRFSMGEIFYFRDRSVSLCDPLEKPGCMLREDPFRQDDKSTLASFLQYQINADLQANAQYEWNPNVNQTQKTAGTLTYLDASNRIFQIGYEYLKRDLSETNLSQDQAVAKLQQSDIAFAWPLTEQWRLLSRWHYDMVQNQTLDMLGGFEYNGCCLGLSIVGSRYLRGSDGIQDTRYAKAVFLQVLFKGLSSVHFNRDTRRDTTAIPGFKPFATATF